MLIHQVTTTDASSVSDPEGRYQIARDSLLHELGVLESLLKMMETRGDHRLVCQNEIIAPNNLAAITKSSKNRILNSPLDHSVHPSQRSHLPETGRFHSARLSFRVSLPNSWTRNFRSKTDMLWIARDFGCCGGQSISSRPLASFQL
jgi:hypothetical protein